MGEMKYKSYSEIQQERAGTLERNELIRQLYRPGLGGLLGKKFGNLSRQRIHQIVHRSEKRQNGFLVRLISKLMSYYHYLWGR